MCRIPHLPNLLGLVRYQNGYADKEMYSTYRDLRELQRAAFRHQWRISSVDLFPPAAPFYCVRKSKRRPQGINPTGGSSFSATNERWKYFNTRPRERATLPQRNLAYYAIQAFYALTCIAMESLCKVSRFHGTLFFCTPHLRTNSK